jgi:excinuclease ABC subunit C
MMKKEIQEKILRCPQSPGVYIFKDAKERYLYVGKATNLRERLKSYSMLRDERPSIPLMVPKIENVEWVITDHEKEAFILENNLIKSYRPKYNIMYRDDKSYVSLKLSKHAFPRLFKTRNIVQDGGQYFGPFSSTSSVNQTLKLIQKIFQVRDCTDYFFAQRTRPCLRYQIKLCSAPCVANITKEKYLEQVLQIRDFMKGDTSQIVKQMKEDMKTSSAQMDYEKAASLRDRIHAIEETLKPQRIESRANQRNADAIGLFGDEDATLIKLLKVRNGRMTGVEEYFVEEPISSSSEIIRSFIQHHYINAFNSSNIPSELILKESVPDLDLALDFLSEQKGTKVRVYFPEKGEKLKLLSLAEKNAQTSFLERKRKSENNLKILSEIQTLLRLPSLPKKIEGFDISNTQGMHSYGSHVVFVDGERDRSQYRLYKIKTVEGPNDFASIKEMLERRLKKIDLSSPPDLLLIDGGRGQLRQAVDVLGQLKLDIPVVSIAKEKELVSKSGTKYAPERLYLPGQKNPIILVPSSPVLHLFQRIRDEAHRFGIENHRRRRSKETIHSFLKQISGVGPKKQRLLLTAFDSIETLQRATLEEIQSVSGIDQKTAQSIFSFFRAMTPSNEEE